MNSQNKKNPTKEKIMMSNIWMKATNKIDTEKSVTFSAAVITVQGKVDIDNNSVFIPVTDNENKMKSCKNI